MGLIRNQDGSTYEIIAATELSEAVTAGLLTQDEARTVYWSQFYVLQKNAAATPPAITQGN